MLGGPGVLVSVGDGASVDGGAEVSFDLAAEQALLERLRALGYATCCIGKWHLGGVQLGPKDWKQAPVPEKRRGGYEYWLAADAVEFTSASYHTALFNNDDERVELYRYRVDALTDGAIPSVSDNR